MRVYATSTDYDGKAAEPWAGPLGMLEARLRAASVEVEKLTRLARFDVDEDGYPLDQGVADTFMYATVAVVEHWEQTGDPTGAVQYEGAVKIGSVSLGTTSVSSDGLTAREKLERRIGSLAIDILANAGLVSSVVAHS